jgi:hypothetical protein
LAHQMESVGAFGHPPLRYLGEENWSPSQIPSSSAIYIEAEVAEVEAEIERLEMFGTEQG